MDCREFKDFCKDVGNDVANELLERICDAHWSGENVHGVEFSDIYTHNACNHTLVGTIEYNGNTYGFVIDNGDNAGTVVNSWGDPEDVCVYNPPKRTRFMFVPKNPFLEQESPFMYNVYLEWKKSDWFQEKLREYHYDRYVHPGCFIENHYREWAEKKGMKIEAIVEE